MQTLLNYARVMITAKRYSEIESLLIAIQGREKQLTNKAGTAAKAGITAEIGTAAKTENSTENAAIDSKLDCTDILVDATLGEVYYKSGRSALALPLLKKAANLYQQSTYYAPLGLYLSTPTVLPSAEILAMLPSPTRTWQTLHQMSRGEQPITTQM